MLHKVYDNFFAKDRIFRHYFQHLIIAVLSFPIHNAILKMLNTKDILFYLIFTFLVDIDAVLYVLRTRNTNSWAHELVDNLKLKKIMKSGEFASTHHKKFSNLYIHNIIGLVFVLVCYTVFALRKDHIVFYSFAAILSHFVFDILDDFYQLGNIKNWLWPLRKVIRK